MPLIGKAWKANFNVWKRHLTLQSVFNHGECMMHVNKNADDHVVDQNVERISREITYVPLGGGIRSKHSSCMQFFFFDWVQDMLTWRTTDPGSCFQRTKDFRALAHVFWGSKVLDPGLYFQRPRIFGSWLMFLEDQGFLRLWLMFSKDQRFWILAHVFRDLEFLDLGSCFQWTKGFLGFGSCFQRSKGSGSWLMFSEA